MPPIDPELLRYDAERRSNGVTPTPPQWIDPPHRRADPRTIAAAGAGILGLFTITGLGVWKLLELILANA